MSRAQDIVAEAEYPKLSKEGASPEFKRKAHKGMQRCVRRIALDVGTTAAESMRHSVRNCFGYESIHAREFDETAVADLVENAVAKVLAKVAGQGLKECTDVEPCPQWVTEARV